MAETALNFGPDWIRALATGSSSSSTTPSTSTPMPIPRYSLAEFRYGREEMLALIPKDMKVPPGLQQYPHLKRDKFQIPLALTPVTEEEQVLWSRCVNSDVALRAKNGQGYGMNRPGRGGSVDRGRGRGRGGYYQRGMMHEDTEDGGFSRPKVERSLSANEKDHRWDDRDRRYDRTYSGRGDAEEGNLKHNTRGPTDYWRKFDKEDDGDWRTTGYRSSDKTGGRGSWRNSNERDRRDMERNPPNRLSGGPKSTPSPQGKLGNHSSWKDENQGSLPEWSIEESSEPDTVGTFDSSGAFLETKKTGDKSLDEVYASDDADEGTNNDSPEAPKESSKKTPKKPPGGENSKKTVIKQNSKPSNENTDEKPSKPSISEPPKSNSKNSPNGSVSKPPESALTRSTVAEEDPAIVKNEPVSISVSQPRDVVNSPKIKRGLSTNVRNSENSGMGEEDAFAHHQKATENMVAQWTEEIEEQRVPSHAESTHPTHEKETKWFYQDPQGEIQGPFASAEMLEWFSAGYFTMGLMVRRSCDEKFSQLGDLIKAWDRVPFMPGSSPPPIRVPLPSTLASPITPTIVPTPVAATPAPLPKQDEQLLALQQQLFQQQIMQQQLMLRQAMLQQLLSELKQQDDFTSLNSQQQEQVLMQQFMAQQQHLLRSNLKPMPESSGLLDSMGAVSRPLLGLSLPAMMKNDLSMWHTPPGALGVWPMNPSESKPPGGSIWDVDVSKQSSDESSTDKQQKLIEEQEKLRAEESRLQHEREAQRKQEELRLMQEDLIQKREELRQKQEELRIQQEMQKEEERKRLEELQRQREEELRKEEEERKKQAELKRLEELREQEEKKQEELRKQEELKRLEELKRKEEQRRLEELKKQQELRKEEKRKKEEQKRLLMEREQQKQLELERQKEALRQKELEREERLLREKQEREEMELKRLAELKIKSQGPVWGGFQQTQSNESELSLADIQRIQEEKEREEREEKLRKQQIQQQVEKQFQQSKNGITWAKRANDAQPAVKSLAEIQQEEAERLAQASRMQKPPPPAPIVNINAGAWGNSSHLNKITAASGWNNTNNASALSGFWEDVPSYNSPPKKPPQKTNNDPSAFPALSNHPVQPATMSSNKSKHVRAKKEEDAIARLFGSHHKPTDEFTKWCTDAISAMPSSVDVPTFVAFLKDIESPYEVYDYVKSYFGEGKEPREFSKQFLEKRSKFRNQAKQAPAEDNSLWGPAPAITPVVNKTSQPSSNDCDGNSSSRGKSKKKKNRMQKLDSSMLGFTVQPNPDRINVGEIDHVENA